MTLDAHLSCILKNGDNVPKLLYIIVFHLYIYIYIYTMRNVRVHSFKSTLAFYPTSTSLGYPYFVSFKKYKNGIYLI